MTSRFYK